MNICVFCSANDVAEKYTTPAIQLATQIGKAGHTLVWGGSNRGLMKVMADRVQANGGNLVGVSAERFKHVARPDADELIIAKDLAERKALLLERADVIVVLAGGLGTLDEVTHVIELKREGVHQKPILFLNTDGFYDGLRLQLKRIAGEGFLPAAELATTPVASLSSYMSFVEDPAAAIALIQQTAVKTAVIAAAI
jgi:uncharacterized protein (TIGR00730 family)